ncbi:hypothetical protein BJ138DRAFT_90292 [Hygrophoropsis aurantiaca]|uniref:Uncharacterized protein n=1 Tax=Hygrophoropsis aurantiaca TaxID=72124 RepID=A0ACB8AR97_9AGAM|nr:hypothetical protein BJ138DRAFT_90292 [Hygrophoropsis aurantiaca]
MSGCSTLPQRLASHDSLPSRRAFSPTIPSKLRQKQGHTHRNTDSTSRSHQIQRRARFDSKEISAGEWIRLINPEGGVYFYHKGRNICTLADLQDVSIQEIINKFAQEIQGCLQLQSDFANNPNMLLVLDYDEKGGSSCGYYLVSCDKDSERRVFWAEDFELSCDIKGCDGYTCLEVEYWKHWQLFPRHCELDQGVIDELKGIILQTSGEHVTAKFSTSQYNKEDLAYMLTIINELDPGNVTTHDYSAWLIGKFMTICKLNELRTTHGQDRDHSSFGLGCASSPYRRSFFMLALSPIMLGSPDIYAAELHSFQDNFTLARWRKFVDKVDISIRDSNLLATVLLGTNIGFLGISSIDEATVPGSRSLIQIIIYCSTIGSLGSIIIGLVIFKQYRAKGADSLVTAVAVLERLFRKSYAVEALAIICSLPYVLLLWSLIFFLAAFSVSCFESTDTATRVPVAVLIVTIFIGVYWCMVVASLPDKIDTHDAQDDTVIEGEKGDMNARKPSVTTWDRYLRVKSHAVESHDGVA